MKKMMITWMSNKRSRMAIGYSLSNDEYIPLIRLLATICRKYNMTIQHTVDDIMFIGNSEFKKDPNENILASLAICEPCFTASEQLYTDFINEKVSDLKIAEEDEEYSVIDILLLFDEDIDTEYRDSFKQFQGDIAPTERITPIVFEK